MSSLSLQNDHRNSDSQPYQPSDQRSSSWLDSFRPPWSQSSRSAAGTNASARASDGATSPDLVGSELEDAVHAALRQSREPADISEPAGFFHELDRRIALVSVAGRFAAAIGVSAIVALFFVFMVPAAQDYTGQTDGPPSGIIQSMKAGLSEPPSASESAKPALCELQNILGAPQTQPAMSHAQSETLLQQFMQWREKPTMAKTP